jgi:hypothetical protein
MSTKPSKADSDESGSQISFATTEAVLVCELNASLSQNVILCDVSAMALLSD